MKLLLTIILLVLFNQGIAQEKPESWIEIRAKTGFLVAHRTSMGHLATDHAFAGELSYYFQPNSEKAWHQAYNNPRYGITLFAGSVGNQEVLGDYFGGYGFIDFPFVKRAHYVFSGKMGVGLGYGSKKYDSETNIYNLAIGSHLNAQICLALENRFIFGKNAITANIDMTHFSNGATKVPNLGLNIPFVSLGYARKITESGKTGAKKEEEDIFNSRFEFGALGIFSTQQAYPTNGRQYPFYGLNLVARRIFTQKSGMEISFDVMSKQSIMVYHSDVDKSQLDIIQLGTYAGYIIPLDKLHIIIGMGVYVRDKYKPADPVYHRLGIRYRFDNGLNLNLTLKSHWARADYIEYGIGYTLKK